MKFIIALALLGTLQSVICEDVRLIDLEPTDAQQILDRQDTSLSYAPKIESNVPAVRYLGADPHHVIEDIYLANQYHGQDGVGGYLYGYKTPDIAKTERKQPQGDLKGAYNYKDNLGHEIKVQYWDDGTGFHQIDNVPKNLPEDAPDVKAEKERFLARWHEEAERNQHPVQDPYERTTGQAQSNYPHQNQNYGQNNYYNQQPAASQQTTQYAQQPSLNEIGGSYQQVSYQQPAGGQSGNYGGHATGQGTGQGQVGGQQQQYQPVGQQHYQPVGGQQQQQYQPVGQQQYQPVGGQQQQQQQYQPVGGQQQYQPAGGQHQVSGYGGQQPQQPVGAVGGQYQGQYEGSSSQQQTSYSQPSYQSGGQGQNKNYYGQGQQNQDEEETTGPPKGFFYNFDYAVPIIVSTGAKAAPGAGLQDIYKSNKAQFESQVQSGSGVASSYSAHQ